MSNLTQTVDKILKEQFKTAVKDGENTMKELAPHPTGASRGKGSMSTGKTKSTIHTEWRGEHEAFVSPSTEYAKYAEQGRGAISKNHVMTFVGSDGRVHRARSVGAMQGWYFVRDTANRLRSKYGG